MSIKPTSFECDGVRDRRHFLLNSSAGAAALALSSAFGSRFTGLAHGADKDASQQHAPVNNKAISELLAERAVRCRNMVLDLAYGPGGMLAAFVRNDTRRPFQDGEPMTAYLSTILQAAWGDSAFKPKVTDWLYGENTLWATGLMLWSQILRYRVTHEAEALATARKCFQDLNHIFSLSRTLEPGLLGKPHGGRPGNTTSYDQSACPVVMYVMFAKEFATPDEKNEAMRNMAEHGEWYLRKQWVMNHHGKLQKVVDPCHISTMKYLACMHAAYDLTGETKFRDVAFHYVRQIIKDGWLPSGTKPYETNHNLFYWAYLCDYWSRTEMAEEFDWVNCIRDYWIATKIALDDEGLLRQGIYDARDNSFTPHPHQWLAQATAQSNAEPAKKELKTWQSSTCYNNRALSSAFSAALAALASSHGLEDNPAHFATRSLVRLDESNMRWWWDDGNFPEDLKPLMNIFGSEVPAAWLMAYWMGKEQKVL
jgi:hypothetical protein